MLCVNSFHLLVGLDAGRQTDLDALSSSSSASGPLPRWSTRFDRLAGNAWLSQIGLQAGYLVVRGVRLLGFLGSTKFEQALYRPIHKGCARRPGSLGQGAHAATPRPVAISAPLKVFLCGLECGIRTEALGADPRTVHQRFGVIRMKTPGAGPRTAPGLLQFCCRCDCFGGTTHRGVSALTRIPSSKRDKISHLSQTLIPSGCRKNMTSLRSPPVRE